jgi:hypothetical protein
MRDRERLKLQVEGERMLSDVEEIPALPVK